MARKTQAEIDARLAELGGTSLVHGTSGQKQIKNPQYNPNDLRSTEPEYLTLDVQQWKSPSGHTLQAYQLPDGSWEVIQDEPAAPKPPTSTATTRPPIPPGGSSVTEGTPLPGGGWDNNRPRQVIRDQDGTVIWAEELTGADLTAWRAQQQASQPQTGEVRKPVEGRPGWTQVTRATTQGGTKTESTVYVGPDGREVPTLPEQTGTVRVPVDGHPGIYLVTTKSGANQTSHYENEAGQKVPQPAAAPSYAVQQRTINGQTYTVITKTPKDGSPPTVTNYGPDGQPVAALPTDEKYAGVPADLPRYTPDLTQPGAGLFAYRDAIDQYMAANPDKLSWQRRQELIAGAQAEAKQVADEFNLGAAILREQYQSNVTQRNQDMTQANTRAALANTHHQNAVALIEKFAPYLGVQPGDAGKVFLGMMASQLATATAYGGMQATPREEMDPRLSAFADRKVGAAPRGPVAPAGVTPGQATAAAALSPVFRPQPPVDLLPTTPDAALAAGVNAARTSPAVQGTPSVVGDTGAPLVGPGVSAAAASATPDPNVGQLGDPIMPPAINPVTGEPTGLAPLPENGMFPQQPDMTQVPMLPKIGAAPGLSDLGAAAFPGGGVPSLRQQASDRRDYLTMPAAAAARVGNVLGLGTLGSPFGGGIDYGAPVGPAPLALQSGIPGLTPDVDAEARRQLALEGVLV